MGIVYCVVLANRTQMEKKNLGQGHPRVDALLVAAHPSR